jgi:hypothetical protein
MRTNMVEVKMKVLKLIKWSKKSIEEHEGEHNS